jgi:hypothetical protein
MHKSICDQHPLDQVVYLSQEQSELCLGTDDQDLHEKFRYRRAGEGQSLLFGQRAKVSAQCPASDSIDGKSPKGMVCFGSFFGAHLFSQAPTHGSWQSL